ncbi:RluA family pseudouridine synthase [Aureibacillus halotolerans]|uniref:RluA family pseudouridine synthase n=1 Tax=Aureibacillus halotolerans TaxID=1508390 RepID=UPI001FB6D507|nr:RluA family pseudouridine synthase [Aureibacillus halotolerans]
MSEETIEFIVEDSAKGERLDKWLSAQLADVSRSQIQGWIEGEHVVVNDVFPKAKQKVMPNDAIVIRVPEPVVLDVVPEDIPIEITYEDEDVLVVNKPSGMVIHPAPGHPNGTLVNALMFHCTNLSGINGVLRPGIVHRLDKDTSGLLMVAKNDKAHELLVRQLQDRSVQRQYQAIVHGTFSHDTGTINASIGRDEKDRQKMAIVSSGGKQAITHFEVIEALGEYSLVTCKLETGRTHQIRVHMNYIGHPVAGDPKYGKKNTMDCDGQALHAGVLGFTHPTSKEFISFSAPPPAVFVQLVEKLRSMS